MSLLPFGGVPPKTNVAGSGITVVNGATTSTISFSGSPGTVQAFFQASSQVTTNSSAVTATTFTTFSNSPALTFTSTTSGTYKIYASVPIQQSTLSDVATIRVINSSGGPTLLDESQAAVDATGAIISSLEIQSVYTLVAGTSYQFDIQGKNGTT